MTKIAIVISLICQYMIDNIFCSPNTIVCVSVSYKCYFGLSKCFSALRYYAFHQLFTSWFQISVGAYSEVTFPIQLLNIAISCFIGPRFNCNWLYLLCLWYHTPLHCIKHYFSNQNSHLSRIYLFSWDYFVYVHSQWRWCNIVMSSLVG